MVDSVLNIVKFWGVITRFAADGHCCIGCPMIRIDSRNNMFFIMLTAAVLIKMDQAIGGINSG